MTVPPASHRNRTVLRPWLMVFGVWVYKTRHRFRVQGLGLDFQEPGMLIQEFVVFCLEMLKNRDDISWGPSTFGNGHTMRMAGATYPNPVLEAPNPLPAS